MTTLDEESKPLLRAIVERTARRQLASINILGHCLKFVGELDVKDVVASELDLSLRLFRQVHSLYQELGWTDLEDAVRDRLEEFPFPESRLEFGLAYYVTGLAEQVAMSAFVDSTCKEFAAIARSHVDAATRRPEPSRFIAYCEDPGNRPHGQQFLDRWSEIGLRFFGTPDGTSDARIVEMGLRSKSTAEMTADFQSRLEPLIKATGLTLPQLVESAANV